ncbi:MAG TPA: helix-turn-helix transcriptional regulator [Vicinamibacterales bacterium]|nr:helix-turn-helix transcriptional regulator [Vicinamibacterales bacterium]
MQTHERTVNDASIGAALRRWRQRRHLSQLDLACDAEISARHLSFVETGRATPSREMVLHLAEQLDVPLRERNALLVAAGYAPVFAERPLNDPALEAARKAVELVLQGHEPYPALAVDRRWILIAANATAMRLMGNVDAALLQPPVNVLRVSLHPSGLAPQIANLPEWRAHIVSRLRRQIDLTADAVLEELLAEIRSYPAAASDTTAPDPYAGVIIPLKLKTPEGVLGFLSTTTVFGTPVDITLSELAVEAFFPADRATADALRSAAAAP